MPRDDADLPGTPIRLGVAATADDPRVGWFLAAARRRRAGIRVVGVSDPAPVLREELTEAGLPVLDDHLALLASARPSLVAVAGRPDSPTMIIDALRSGADVIATAPVCAGDDAWQAIADAVAATGRGLTAAHTLRGHPAALVARQLITDGTLGDPELVSLIVPAGLDRDELRRWIVDTFDLFLSLTGCTSGTVTAVDDDHQERLADPAEFAAAYGELIMIARSTATGSGPEVVCEVRERRKAEPRSIMVQVAGSSGAVEWDVRTGLLRSSVNGGEPRVISCGRFDRPDEWVLNNLLRRRIRLIPTAQSLITTRMLLLADRSARDGGAAQSWQLRPGPSTGSGAGSHP